MNWDNYLEIGVALQQTYPAANHLTLEQEELVALVTKLPGFEDAPTPPDQKSLSAISFAWVAAAAGPDDSGPYDLVA